MRFRAFPQVFIASVVVFSATASFAAGTHVREVRVSSARLHVGDILPAAAPDAAAVDLGPAPSADGSRVVDRAEIEDAIRASGAPIPSDVPATVRVVRKTKRLDILAIERLTRESLETKLPLGVALAAIHPTHAIQIPDGYTRISAEFPRPPHRKGSVTSAAIVTFYEGEEKLAAISVPIELSLSEAAAAADVIHGARVTLIIQRGLVEVSSAATAGTDGDIGNVIPIVLHPSGRTLLGRLESKDRAIAVAAQ